MTITERRDTSPITFPLAPGIKESLARSTGTAYGLSVWENGHFTTEVLTPSCRSHNCYSVAKVFTLTALGFLIDRKRLRLDEKVHPILAPRFPADFDPKWKTVTISDLIRHRFGLEKPGFLDIDCKSIPEQGDDDFLALVLREPLTGIVGETYAYTDAAYYLLSRIFTERAGVPMADFLREELMKPLHFQEYAFSVCPHGHAMGATGLYLSTEDMAKLGVLYAQEGIWEGKRLLSGSFVTTVLRNGYELAPQGDNGSYAKGGMYGQWLYINPTTQRVVAIHGHQLDLETTRDFLLENDRPSLHGPALPSIHRR